jgi:glycosyltransferase involved in cell wall biosynthesis
MPAYNAEAWIGSTLESVLAQTLPADEVIVVNDGSTDGTARVAEQFGDSIRVVHQENGGCPAAFNRAFGEASGIFVALCPADDLWEPQKLEWQAEAIANNPDVDVVFGHATYFGLTSGDFPAPPGTGLLDLERLTRAMFEQCVIADPTAVVRKELHQALSGYREDIIAEDYEFWMRALRAGASFYYEPRPVAKLRHHGGNISTAPLRIWEANYNIHTWHADLADDELVRRTLARDLRTLARARLGANLVSEGRAAYVRSLRHQKSVVALAGAAVLALPGAERTVQLYNSRKRSQES